MMDNPLLGCILVPAIAGVIALIMGSRPRGMREAVVLVAMLANLYLVWSLQKGMTCSLAWVGGGLSFILTVTTLSKFILMAMAGFGVAIAFYSSSFLLNHRFANQFYGYFLFTVAMGNGVLLADNLVQLLFFWEGLLLTLFGMIAIGNPNAWKTAVKALIIIGITDICLMFGIALIGWQAGTLVMSEIAGKNLKLGDSLNSLAFVFLMIGAISKGGAIPFHTWIPDAAVDAPLPFMALIPGAYEKLLGIYLLTRISLDLFVMEGGHWVNTLMMVVGAATILVAVMMALVQKDYKRLLAYHAISQVGYMILGIGTATTAGIIGGLFHMINNALYKSCLFLTGGSVEKQTGTTDLRKLGGLKAQMPITCICFLVAAYSISGGPLSNGFFSKELVYDGALERGFIFYLAAAVGSFLTAASFLKLGHAAYFDKLQLDPKEVREAPLPMLLPMIVIAATCALFGLACVIPGPWHQWPIRVFQPVLEGKPIHGGMEANWVLIVASLVVLGLAILNHSYGVKKTGRGVGAVDHIHHAPVLSGLYDKAERRVFDPYDIGMRVARGLGAICWGADRFVNWLSDGLLAGLAVAFGWILRICHTGNYSTYLMWAVTGSLVIIWFFMK
jgi:NADH-quinone oxidoreductase subunit L